VAGAGLGNHIMGRRRGHGSWEPTQYIYIYICIYIYIYKYEYGSFRVSCTTCEEQLPMQTMIFDLLFVGFL